VKKLRIISTPNGLNNKFAQIWKANTETNAPIFHATKVTIHDAIRSGLPLDPTELQAGLNDPEAWAQEYLCEFMDNSTVLLPYDLIETCESPLATELSDVQSLSASALPGNAGGNSPELYAGLDFARKNHMTVLWILEKFPPSSRNLALNPDHSSPSAPFPLNTAPLFLTREVLCLRNTSTPEQLELLRPRLNLCRKVCLDYTGPGVGLGDFLHRELGTHKIELCPFTAPFKAELFPRLATAMESRQLLIPIGRDIREDLHSIYRTTTNSGTILYRAHATPDGHADRTTALALALRAAQTAPAYALAKSIGRKYPMYRNAYPQRTIAIIY
jgi:phage FluMu gp28-like protein